MTNAPQNAKASRAVTILVHGRNETPEKMLAVAERFSLPDMTFVTVTAPGGSWYPESFLAPLEKNQPHLDNAIATLNQMVRDLEAKGHARSQIALLGFSQGACLACEAMYRAGGAWGALIAFTGGLIGPPEMKWSASNEEKRSLAETPIFLGTSDVDAWVPLSRVQQTAAAFEQRGARVELTVYPNLEHLVSDEEIAAARPLLAALLES